MAEQTGLVRYEASDGTEVELTPSIVAKYVITGGQQVDEREIAAFIARCRARRLNPLAGDAYMTTYRNKRTGQVEASVIVSKDYFVRTATQQPGFDGMTAGVVVQDRRTGQLAYRPGSIVGPNEDLLGGWAEVYDKRRSHPSRAEVGLGEYNTGRSLWASKPATMIRKVALVQALREAYPGAFGGVYDSAEMPDRRAEAERPQDQGQPAQAEAVEVQAEAAPQQDGPDEAWVGQVASELGQAGFDPQQVRDWLLYQWQQGGRDAAEAAAAQMRAQAQGPAQDAGDVAI